MPQSRTGRDEAAFRERRIADIARGGVHDGRTYVSTNPGDAQLESVVQPLLQLSRKAKRAIMIGSDALMLPIAFWLSMSLKFDSVIPLVDHTATFACVIVFGVASFSALGLYRAVI